MQLPATFGKYELLERIATGGMAEVYLARRFGIAGFEKRLVIKRIRQELARDPHHINLFINEAKIGVHLNHENVVQVYDLGRAGSDWYIAMEHLHGRDLNKLVKALRVDGRLLPREVAVHVVAEVCRGLAYAHGLQDTEGRPLGLVHRDVSPHNVLLTFNGAVKLVDFGIARLVGTGSVPRPATPQANGGTPGSSNKTGSGRRPGGGKYAYMSPEQARGEAVDHRTDVFSAGIVLWELLAGHRLFQDPDPAEKLRQVQEARVPDLADEGIHVDPRLERILATALAADRNDRYASAALLEEDLRAWLFEHEGKDARKRLVDLLRECFPSDAKAQGRAPGLQRMLADVERLGGELSTQTPAGTPSQTSLPDRLRQASGERKRVVAMVIDVDGMTDLSARLEPELLFRRHYQLLRWLRRIVGHYDGLVQRVVDDQVLVFFGVPRTRVDDLARALECALELCRTVGDLQRVGLSVHLAIGLHIGDVTVSMGKRQARYTARGDTTRLARRLSAVADHAEILVSQAVCDASDALFRYGGGPAVSNRGGKHPTPSFSLEGRRHGLRIAGKGPWLRRGREVEVIRGALQDLSNGIGRVIRLIGDVGSGKTRLAREVRDLALRRGVPAYLARAGAWRSDDPLALFRDLTLSVLGLDPDAPRGRVAEEVERLPQLGLGPREQAAFRALLGIGSGKGPGEDEVWLALERMLTALAATQHTIVILEDVHHLAPEGLVALRSMLAMQSERGLLIVVTHTGHPVELDGLGEAVELGRFGRSGQRRLLRELLQAEVVDEELVDLAARTSEGNPLYVEEMVKYLVAQGRILTDDGRASLVQSDQQTGIPDSLAGLIAARIDALEPASKGALQLAATVGAVFPVALVGRAMGLEDPTAVVTELASHGLLKRASDGADAWTFSSDLVREVATRSILGVQRRTYHRLVAEALEALYEDDLEAHAEELAHHCAEAGRTIDAARYLHMAGQRLERGQFLEAARLAYERGLRQVHEIPETPDTWDARVQGESMLSYRSGALSRLLGEERRAERSLQVALDISGDAGLPWIEVRAHLELGRLYLARGDARIAEAHIGQARSLARIEQDAELQLETLEAAANLAYERGENEQAEALWREALEHADGDTAVQARCTLGMASRHIRDGELEEAAALLERALEAARASGDRILVGRVLNNMGLLHYWSERYDEALTAFRQALQVREGIGYSAGVVINHHNIGDVHFSRGDLPRAWVAFTRSRELADAMGWERGVVLNEVYLGTIRAMREGLEHGLPDLLGARARALTLGDVEIAANAALQSARLLRDAGRLDEARELLVEARSEAAELGLRTMLDSLDALWNETFGEGSDPESISPA